MLALAGRATVAEMAEAAMTEKRLKFIAITLGDSVSLLAYSGRGANLTPRVITQKFIAALTGISAIDSARLCTKCICHRQERVMQLNQTCISYLHTKSDINLIKDLFELPLL